MALGRGWARLVLLAWAWARLADGELGSRHEKFETTRLHVEGEIMVAGLFPMHGDGSSEGRHCGRIKGDKGIQRLEAMLYAVDKINREGLVGANIGFHIRDTCSQDTHALEQTLEFIKTAISTKGNEGQYSCPGGADVLFKPSKPTVAVIGAASSQVSAMVANMLRLFKIPQISYSSTSAELSDKGRFTYFSRVVPSDSLQAQAMVDVVSALGWNYVNAVFDEGNYGEKGIESFRKLAPTKSICIALSEKIRRSFQETDFDDLVLRLAEQSARGVVMFVNEDNVRKILSSTVRLGLAGQLWWMASDSWGAKRAPLEGDVDEAAHAAITIEPKRKEIRGFDDYFTKLKPANNTRNPWFPEFWASRFNCTVLPKVKEDDEREPPRFDGCSGEEDLVKGHQQESYVPYVVDAVYLLAHSIKALIQDECGSMDIARCKPKIAGPLLLEYIRNVSFTGEQGAKVALDAQGDRMGRYNIFQYHYRDKTYHQVGEWIEGLRLNRSELEAAWAHGIPSSVCSQDCAAGKVRQYTQERCCWVCSDCNASSILPNETTCAACGMGFLPNGAKNACVPMVPERMEWGSAWAIVPAAFSSLGILATMVVIYTFVRYNETPIIRASGRELCYFMIAGVLCSYVMTFVLLNPPSAWTCGATRLFLGLFLCAIYAAILTKTSRLSRVFTGNLKSARRPRFLTPGAQVGICSSMVSVQLVGAVVWLAVEPPATILLYPDRLTAVLSCRTTATPLLLSLSYDGLLIFLCTIYAFKTRKIPENFNETKYIGFTMYATCIVWLAFITIYFATHHNFRIRITSLCMCISISGTVTLALFFAPKVYIVLFQPEKNVRDRSAMTGFQKLVQHHISQQMRVVKEDEGGFVGAVSPPTGHAKTASTAALSSNSLLSSSHATEDSALRHRAPSNPSSAKACPKANGPSHRASLGFASSVLAPMEESSSLTYPVIEPSRQPHLSTAEINVVGDGGAGEEEGEEGREEEGEEEPFISRPSRLNSASSSLQAFPTAEELAKKESWVVQRAEVEMILTEIVSQEGTVV